ncbi:hypothetical protein HY086_04415 [Candidatus Gottesmanbacteria bacterium]|nr:hypothetical protein [Candidatus Gottesmanbacteria bacterium]
MVSESAIAYENLTKGSEALVIHNGLQNLDHPSFLRILEKVNFPVNLFKKLLTLDHSWVLERPREGYAPAGTVIEDVILRIANTLYGEIEVSDVFPIVASENRIRVRSAPFHGFETIYVLEGEAVFDFPEDARPVALGVILGSERHTPVTIRKGDLVFVPSQVARGLVHVNEGFQYRYMAQPPWDMSLITKVY